MPSTLKEQFPEKKKSREEPSIPRRVYFRGTRVIRSSPGARYGLDNFSGTVDYQRGRFVGVFHDGRRTTGKVLLKKK